MTSQARIDANRQNAQLSTGPRTEEGKQASSKNATKHGFFARLLPNPTPEFREMLTGLYHSLRPEDEIQQLLVDQIGLAYLRLARLYQQELQDLTPPAPNPPLAGGQGGMPLAGGTGGHLTPALTLRYETMLNRQIERNLLQLHDLQDRAHPLIVRPKTDPPFLPTFAEDLSSTVRDLSPFDAMQPQGDTPSTRDPDPPSEAVAAEETDDLPFMIHDQEPIRESVLDQEASPEQPSTEEEAVVPQPVAHSSNLQTKDTDAETERYEKWLHSIYPLDTVFGRFRPR